MSALQALAVLLASMPVGYGVTRPRHERWRARWWLRRCAGIGDARENEPVVAAGIVRPLDETLVAPLSGRTCVAYRSRAWISPPGGMSSGETTQLRPFALDLGEEEIIVTGEHAIWGLPPAPLLPRNLERESSFLARHALTAQPARFGYGRVASHARFTEVALEPGARVAVGGTLVLVPPDEPPDDERGFRDLPPPEARIVGNRARPLVFVDLDTP